MRYIDCLMSVCLTSLVVHAWTCAFFFVKKREKNMFKVSKDTASC